MFIRTTLICLMLMAVPYPASATAYDGLESFEIKSFSGNEFASFVEIFSEMRGPLRVRIMEDRKTGFEEADPLEYVTKLKGEKDVKKMLKKHGMKWEEFVGLMGNVLIAYMSIQPDKTKAAIVKRMADYGLALSDDQIPAEYRDVIRQFVKTDAGSQIAAMALEFIVQVPEQNIAIVRDNKLTLDKMFYTRFWKDRI